MTSDNQPPDTDAKSTRVTEQETMLKVLQTLFESFVRRIRYIQAMRMDSPIVHAEWNFQLSPHAAQDVNTRFWNLMDILQRPTANGEVYVGTHLLCSILESSVLCVEPIRPIANKCLQFPSSTVNLNCRLAFHCAITYMATQLKAQPDQVGSFVSPKIRMNHMAWLDAHRLEQRAGHMDSSHSAILANAACWQLIEENFMLRRPEHAPQTTA